MSFTLSAAIISAFLLSACTTTGQSSTTNIATNFANTTEIATNFIQRQDVIKTSKTTYPAKNPTQVAFYSGNKTPHAPYRIIGVAKVSKYNLLGMQRENHTVNSMMQNLAASIGGDGLINVSAKNDQVEASIIAFQKILL
jgi:hypothetical protein